MQGGDGMLNGWLEDAEKVSYMAYFTRIRTVNACPVKDDETYLEMIEHVLRDAAHDPNISVASFVSLCVNAYARG